MCDAVRRWATWARVCWSVASSECADIVRVVVGRMGEVGGGICVGSMVFDLILSEAPGVSSESANPDRRHSWAGALL